MAYALEIQDVHKVFNRGTINEKVALNGVNLNLNPGDFVTIIGGNGAGKSTTLNAIAGVWPIDSGKIIIDGTDITNLPEHKRAKYLGRVFQDPMTGTAATMDIEENMAIALRRGEKRTLRWGVSREDRELFREKLQTLGLGLEDRMTSKVGLLSGGQRQAITLLMAALKQPKLLLLDEHTAALDPKTAAILLAHTARSARIFPKNAAIFSGSSEKNVTIVSANSGIAVVAQFIRSCPHKMREVRINPSQYMIVSGSSDTH